MLEENIGIIDNINSETLMELAIANDNDWFNLMSSILTGERLNEFNQFERKAIIECFSSCDEDYNTSEAIEYHNQVYFRKVIDKFLTLI